MSKIIPKWAKRMGSLINIGKDLHSSVDKNFMKHKLLDWFKFLGKQMGIAFLLVTLSVGLSGATWNLDSQNLTRISMLAQGDAITDPTSLLRYALPIDNDKVRQLQKNIEELSKYLRSKRWGPIVSNVKDADIILTLKSDRLLASIPPERQEKANTIIEQLKTNVKQLKELAETKNKEEVWAKRRDILDLVTQLEELMVVGFPFEVPREYANLPQLKGRATVEMQTTQGVLTIVLDGYSAPVNAGNFADLVQRGFYDGLPFTRAEDYFVLQAGDPPGPAEGYIDEKTGIYRAIPLEVLVRGEKTPVYGTTLEDTGMYLADPVLPFSAYGALALARPGDDPNGGSSQFFFFKFDNEVTPPGFNLMDGRYSVFGYVIKGKEVLDKITADDKIISAKIVSGAENLLEPKA